MYIVSDPNFKVKPHFTSNYPLASLVLKNLEKRYNNKNLIIEKSTMINFHYLDGLDQSLPNFYLQLGNYENEPTNFLKSQYPLYIILTKSDYPSLKDKILKSKRIYKQKYDGLFHKIHMYNSCLCLSEKEIFTLDYLLNKL